MEYKTGIVILAAGSSSRLGSPKQLLKYEGQSLIKRIVTQAGADNTHKVVVVTGSNAKAIESEIGNKDVLSCINDNWQSGMGSSISVGLKQLLQVSPEIEQCIICVSDQPYVTTSILDSLKQAQAISGKGIVASQYSGTMGVPALFAKPYFGALLGLAGEQGAKAVLQKYNQDVFSIDFEEGSVDIDTLEDYKRLTNQK
jgi:molybdenum cofactor cytidylyltransferase